MKTVESSDVIKRPRVVSSEVLNKNLLVPVSLVAALVFMTFQVAVMWTERGNDIKHIRVLAENSNEISKKAEKAAKLAEARVTHFRRAAEAKLGPLPDYRPVIIERSENRGRYDQHLAGSDSKGRRRGNREDDYMLLLGGWSSTVHSIELGYSAITVR